MAVFRAVAPCSLVEVYRRITLITEAASTSETSINFYQTTRRKNPEDNHLHTRRRENPKSHKNNSVPYSCVAQTFMSFRRLECSATLYIVYEVYRRI
jgi:hypothetical protein